MPDQNDQTPSSPSPQSLVDAALDTAPVMAPISPMTPPPLAPLSQPEPPTTTTTTTTTTMPVTPIAEKTPSVAMGDDTPLAFAVPVPSVGTTPSTTPPEQQSSYLPPITPIPSVAPKPVKKNKVGVIVGGILLLVIMLGGGVWGYQNYQAAQIAKVEQGSGTETGGSRQSGLGGTEIGDTGNRRDNENGGRIVNIKGEPVGSTTADGASCDGGKGIMKDRKCIASDITPCLPGDSCPSQCTPTQWAKWLPTQEPGGGSSCVGTRLCHKYRIERMESRGGTHCFVGYGEQCEEAESCGPKTEVVASPSPSPTPTMACTRLTSVPALTPPPIIGTKLTFTCAGTVTPPTAGTLTYRFRYSINSGAKIALANKTATTAELKILACGSYLVECQACAAMTGSIKCNPIWTGATQ